LYAACPGDAINFILGISTLYRSKIYRHPDIEKWPQTVYDRPMQAPFSSIPWNTPALWCEANASLAAAVGRNRPVLAEPQRQAGRIQRLYQLTFPLMDRLCSETCPDCTDICCRRAWVWADFKDLLFFHLADIPCPTSNCCPGGKTAAAMGARTAAGWNESGGLLSAPGTCARRRPSGFEMNRSR
jgi:hypothetical protein